MRHADFEFLHRGEDLAATYHGSYDLLLVAISVLVAAVAGLAAMRIAERLAVPQRSTSRYAFLANMSHKIRTSMNGVMACRDCFWTRGSTTASATTRRRS